MNKSNFIQGFFAIAEVHTNKVSLDEFYTGFFTIFFHYRLLGNIWEKCDKEF